MGWRISCTTLPIRESQLSPLPEAIGSDCRNAFHRNAFRCSDFCAHCQPPKNWTKTQYFRMVHDLHCWEYHSDRCRVSQVVWDDGWPHCCWSRYWRSVRARTYVSGRELSSSHSWCYCLLLPTLHHNRYSPRKPDQLRHRIHLQHRVMAHSYRHQFCLGTDSGFRHSTLPRDSTIRLPKWEH